MGKNKAEAVSLFLNRVIREGLTEEMTCEQSF